MTDEAQNRIVQLIRAGSYTEVATAAAGVPRRTFYEWWQRGDPEGTSSRDRECRRFRERIEQARDEGEARNVAAVAQAATTNWLAAAWLLERRHPERWARLSQREKDQPSQPPVPAPAAADVFAEVDELAKRRQSH